MTDGTHGGDGPEAEYFSSMEEVLAHIEHVRTTDPRSIDYIKQPQIRPKISVVKAMLNVLAPFSAVACLFLTLFFSNVTLWVSVVWPLSLLTLYAIMRINALAIWSVKLYQAVSPERVRNRCRFVPSCSVYAIQAFEKYGFLKGFKKTVSRLRRCRPPNGGDDPLI